MPFSLLLIAYGDFDGGETKYCCSDALSDSSNGLVSSFVRAAAQIFVGFIRLPSSKRICMTQSETL